MKNKLDLLVNDYRGLDIIKEIDGLTQEVNKHRPFSQEVEAKVMQKLRLNWNYHSNAIEGNKLSYGETVALLMHGVTAKGKPLKDHLDIQGHDSAISMMIDLIKSRRVFTQNDIRELHQVILKEPYYVNAETSEGKSVKKLIKIGQYKTEPNHVRTKSGQIHFYTEPEFVNSEMSDLVEWVREQIISESYNPLLIATIFHHKFVAIHPFDDGNGRLGRILMNFILMQNQLPPAVIKQSEKDVYYGALAQADAGEFESLIEFIGKGVKESLHIQLSALDGKDISTLEDLDKEIALFKASLSPAQKGKFKKTEEQATKMILNDILPFFKDLDNRLFQFTELFKSHEIKYQYSNPNITGQFFKSYANFEKDVKSQLSNGRTNMLSFNFEYKLNDFKSNRGENSMSIPFIISFKEYFYELNMDRFNVNLNFEKTYDQFFTELERNKVIEVIVKSVITRIKSFTK